VPFFVSSLSLVAATFDHAVSLADDDSDLPSAPDEKTNESTAACAACLAGVIACV
jgi:hypothetical protein